MILFVRCFLSSVLRSLYFKCKYTIYDDGIVSLHILYCFLGQVFLMDFPAGYMFRYICVYRARCICFLSPGTRGELTCNKGSRMTAMLAREMRYGKVVSTPLSSV